MSWPRNDVRRRLPPPLFPGFDTLGTPFNGVAVLRVGIDRSRRGITSQTQPVTEFAQQVGLEAAQARLLDAQGQRHQGLGVTVVEPFVWVLAGQ